MKRWPKVLKMGAALLLARVTEKAKGEALYLKLWLALALEAASASQSRISLNMHSWRALPFIYQWPTSMISRLVSHQAIHQVIDCK